MLDLNHDNCYDLLPEFKSVVLKDTGIPEIEFFDICLAICAADKLVGTNRLELSIDKFCIVDDTIWNNFVQSSNTSPVCTGLPKIQRLRVVTDALMMVLQKTGHELTSSYNSEASKTVARMYGISHSTGVYDNENTDGVYESLLEIKNLYDSQDADDKKQSSSETKTVVEKLLDYIKQYGVCITLDKTTDLPRAFLNRDCSSVSNVRFTVPEYNDTVEKNFICSLNDTLVLSMLRGNTLNIAFYIAGIKNSLISNKSLLCISSDVYRKLFNNSRLSNVLSTVFNFSAESTSDIRSTYILITLLYCKPSDMASQIFTIMNGGIK